MQIRSVKDLGFKKYGRILSEYNFNDIIEEMKEIQILEDVVYEPSLERLEQLESYTKVRDAFFGGLPIQIGYCNGKNTKLNAVEYHRSSEINIAITDMIILIGLQQDIKDDYSYDTSNIEAFIVPAGTAIEIFATTLHYAPCNANDKGFKCVVILPKDTNLPLIEDVEKKGESALLFARNKWLIGHSESGLDKSGAFIGLNGENIDIK